jgi:hypothetical protein
VATSMFLKWVFAWYITFYFYAFPTSVSSYV